MGLFFDDKKTEKSDNKKESTQPTHGFFGALILLLIAGFLTFLSWIFKPLLTWAFTFENKTRKQVITQLVVVSTVFIVPLYLLYSVPFVRDFVSLSNTHTINLNRNGYRIIFPNRTYFVPQENKLSIRDDRRQVTYFTYSGHTPYVAQKVVDNGECHMVYRGRKLVLTSVIMPMQAEGFDDLVIYPIKRPVSRLPFWRLLYEKFKHPSYFFKNKNELDQIDVVYEYESSWGELLKNWDLIEDMGDGYKPYELKALANEHAIICF